MELHHPAINVKVVAVIYGQTLTELDGLPGDRERAGNHRLRGDHRRRRGQYHHRDQRPAGGQQVERQQFPAS